MALLSSGVCVADVVQISSTYAHPLSTAAFATPKFLFGTQVMNQAGFVQGARINFSVPPGCGTFNGAQSVEAITDANGIASAGAFIAGAPGYCAATVALVGTSVKAQIDYVIWDPATLRIVPVNPV
ncbi:MAG TPA: hypothetical protein VF348_04690, partial [Usitatibacter sp.]